MQLIPETGARTASAYLTGRHCSIPDAALFRPRLNILLGVAYLECLWMRKFGRTSPDICRTLICVAAYNAGPNRISRWLTDLRRTEQPSLAAQDFVTDEILFTLTTTLPWRETRLRSPQQVALLRLELLVREDAGLMKLGQLAEVRIDVRNPCRVAACLEEL